MSTECPFKATHSKEWLEKMMIVSEDHRCIARKCPVLKDYIDKPMKNTYKGDCPYLQKHPCPYFEKMMEK